MIDPYDLAAKFCAGKNVYDVAPNVWQSAFQLIDENLEDLVFDKHKVHLLWIESGGHLRNKIRDDSLVLRILRKALPGYQGLGLTLYRGECEFLYLRDAIGFSWTPDVKVAETFASGLNAIESRGALLTAYAPPEAILAPPNSHSADWLGEHEYTCDPGRLRHLTLVRAFPQRQ